MERRKFSREFKIEAVKLVRERGVKVAQAARDLDVHATVWTCNGFVPVTYLIMPPWLRMRAG